MRWSGYNYYAFVVSPNQPTPVLIDLGPAKQIEADVGAVRKHIADFQEKLAECENPEEALALEKKEEQAFRKTSAQAYKRLLGPLKKAIGDAKLLYIAADGELNRLPFAALVDGNGKYLIETRRCAYLSSGRDLLRPATKPGQGTVVFAGPDFKADAAQRLAQIEKVLPKNKVVATRGELGSGLRSKGWSPLPGAAAEAKSIRSLLQDSKFGPVTTYTGSAAAEEVFKAMPAPRVLHLATHGFYLDREPPAENIDFDGAGAGFTRARLRQADNPLLRSGIVLAGANTIGDKDAPAGDEDGWVTAEEISLLNLQGTELVVLSACQTGLGDIKTGEGVYGLRRAFLYAGARTLVTSLFEVPDRETSDLMNRFYTGLNKGQGKLAALHTAQDELRRSRAAAGAAHPFFWASFVLVGSPD
jgi:CHAT domain-containing protein